MAHVTLWTIRYYDKQNILKPSYVTEAGARFYTDEDFARLLSGARFLVGVGISSVLGLKRKTCPNNIQVTLQLCIIGITLFELLFEARARYLYLYVPVYMLLFVLNGDCLEGHLKKK